MQQGQDICGCADQLEGLPAFARRPAAQFERSLGEGNRDRIAACAGLIARARAYLGIADAYHAALALGALRARLMHELRRAAAEEGVSDADLLALLAFETGALLACQDPRILMAEEGVDLVWRNIAAGNLAALTLIRSGPGRKT